MSKIVPAPWNLNGDGYILLYKFPRAFVENQINISSFSSPSSKFSYGAVMIVDYKSSNVGPYQELLFIPGRLKYNNKKFFSISKIYVSTQVSIDNGRKNWAIPKELASFEKKSEYSKERVKFFNNDNLFFDAKFDTKKFAFPINTSIFPITIIQNSEAGILKTILSGKGKARITKLESIKINSKYFPDISQFNPYITIKIEDFNLIFPKAEII